MLPGNSGACLGTSAVTLARPHEPSQAIIFGRGSPIRHSDTEVRRLQDIDYYSDATATANFFDGTSEIAGSPDADHTTSNRLTSLARDANAVFRPGIGERSPDSSA